MIWNVPKNLEPKWIPVSYQYYRLRLYLVNTSFHQETSVKVVFRRDQLWTHYFFLLKQEIEVIDESPDHYS